MVVPNRVHASRNRPLLVKYGPIRISVWMLRRDGLCIKDASRKACMAAATGFMLELLNVSTSRPTVHIALLHFLIDYASVPSLASGIPT